MQINLYASFRERAGSNRLEIIIAAPATVQSAIQQIVTDYPALKDAWLDQNGDLLAHVHVSLNQVDVMALPDQLQTKVQDTDILDFFPPIHGG